MNLIKFIFFASNLFIVPLVLGLVHYSQAGIDPNLLPRVDWTFQSAGFKATAFAYTPFFINGSGFTSYSAGY